MLPCMSEPDRKGTVIASLTYRDANAGIDWLKAVLGFVEHAVYRSSEGAVEHAELTFGSGMIMLGTADQNRESSRWMALPAHFSGKVTSSLYLTVPDCTPVWAQVKNAGAEILLDLRTMDYGGQSFTVRDPEGHVWSVGEYDPWAAPAG